MATAPAVIRVTDEDQPADIIEAIARLNADAKAMRRRGYIGTRSAQYAATHMRIDALLTDLEAAR